MKVQGKIFEINHLVNFATSYFLNRKNPDSKTFEAACDLRIHVASITNLPGFYPSFSVKGTSDANGNFKIDTSSLPKQFDAYLLAYKKVQEIEIPILGHKIPIYQPVYRSNRFSVAEEKQNIKIYFSGFSVADKAGISQTELNQKIKQVQNSLANVEKLSAYIDRNKIAVSGKGKGADVTFNIKLSPYTGSDLTTFVRHQIEDFDIDLPGPDFITGLCVDEGEIEDQIKKSVRKIVDQMNKAVLDSTIDTIAAALGDVSKEIVRAYFNQNATLTFGGVRYPVTSTQQVGRFTIQRRSIIPVPYFGFPRNL
ncbi:MAG: hypothetical protein H6668_16980 [Ardenticatenaceae bacterium]|nr:hypothetical protein [Ardenticatenaceae bacterium]